MDWCRGIYTVQKQYIKVQTTLEKPAKWVGVRGMYTVQKPYIIVQSALQQAVVHSGKHSSKYITSNDCKNVQCGVNWKLQCSKQGTGLKWREAKQAAAAHQLSTSIHSLLATKPCSEVKFVEILRTNRGKKNFGDLTIFQRGRVGKSRSRHSKCKTCRMIIAVGFRVGLEDIRFSLTFT